MARILAAWDLWCAGRITEAQLDELLSMAEVVNRICGDC